MIAKYFWFLKFIVRLFFKMTVHTYNTNPMAVATDTWFSDTQDPYHFNFHFFDYYQI